MATGRGFRKFFTIGGLDFSTSLLGEGIARARYLKNLTRRLSGAVGRRPGYRYHAQSLNDAGGYGLFSYMAAGMDSELLVIVDGAIKKINETELQFSFSGSSGSFSFQANDSTENGYFWWSTDLDANSTDTGSGFGGSPITISDLATVLDAVTGFTVTSQGGDNSVPASFAEVIDTRALAATLNPVKYWYLSTLNTNDGTDPFDSFDDSTDDLGHVQGVNVADVCFLTTPGHRIVKYDGHAVYSPGLPKATAATPVAVGGGTLGPTSSGYSYQANYVFVDNKGNVTEGPAIGSGEVPLSSGEDMQVTMSCVTTPSNYYARSGTSTSNQTGTTINLDDGSGGNHNIIAGDTVYLLDRATSEYVTRSVATVTSTSITVDSSVQVNNNDVISSNLRVQLWRTTDGGSTLYLQGEYPQDVHTGSIVIVDSTVDDDLGREKFVTPIGEDRTPIDAEFRDYDPTTQPFPTYDQIYGANAVTVHQGMLVFGWSYYLRWSLPTEYEYFPYLNYEPIQAEDGDEITGLASTGNVLLVFKENSIHAVVGDLNGQFTVTVVSNSIGCASSASLKEGKPGEFFFVSKRGVELINTAYNPRVVTFRISQVFDNINRADPYADNLKLKRSTGIVDRLNSKYLLYIPEEEATVSGNRVPQSGSKCYEIDYSRIEGGEIEVFEWMGINMYGGAVRHNDDTWFIARMEDSSQLDHYIGRFVPIDSNYAFADHMSQIDVEWKSQWDTAGDPAIEKKLTKVTTYHLDLDKSPTFSSTVTLYKDFDESSTWSSFPLPPFGGTPRVVTGLPKADKVQAVQYKIENTEKNVDFFFDGIELEYAPDHRRQIRQR